MKSATGISKEKNLSPNIQQKKDAQSQSTNISWKVDKARQGLRVKYYINVEKHGLVIQAISKDLTNILGTTTIIDCQNAEQRQKSSNTVDGKFHGDQQNISEQTVVKNFGHWPVDIKAGSRTMSLYCDLVQNETLGDIPVALLRSIPLDSLSSTNQYRREKNQRSFSNLQRKRIYKSQFQSNTLTLASETGQRMPFLSCGRISITLALRSKPH